MGMLSSKAASLHNLEASLLGQREACPKGCMRHKVSCTPNCLAVHLHGGFLGTSKSLALAKQADDHPIVYNNETYKLGRAE